MLQVDGMAGNPTTSLFLMRRLMGYQFSWETCISSGQYWPQSCQGGPTLGLEGFLRTRGDDGRGWIQDFLFRDFF